MNHYGTYYGTAFIYEKSLWDHFDVGSHINVKEAIKQWDPFNDSKPINAITHFNLQYGNRLILVVWDPPNVGTHDESPIV